MLRIKELRLKNKLNQSELADKIGVSLRTIQHYEAETTDIPVKNLHKLAKLFNVNIVELYSDNLSKEPNNEYGLPHQELTGDIVEDLRNKIYLLQDKIKDKEEIIYLLKEKLKLYE